MHGTGCQYFFYMCIYVYCLFFFEKSRFSFSAATSCSCIETVDEQFQDTMGYNCMDNDVNTIPVCVYMTIVYSALRKKEIFLISAADTICSCTEAVDELFQHILGHQCMEPYIITISARVYIRVGLATFWLSEPNSCYGNMFVSSMNEIHQVWLHLDKLS